MERRKKILAILIAAVITVAIFSPLLLLKPVIADEDSWYTNVSGVLADDYYSLYPFEKKNLKFGFSKFGELIDSRDAYNIGLEYDTRDPFAPPAGSSVPDAIPKHKWSQGWLINITYYHVPTGAIRNVWACALHSDLTSYGNDWLRVDNDWYGGVSGGPTYEWEEDPRDPGRLISNPTSTTYTGGRKTNGTVTTDAIRVLYNGPRMYIARTVNHIKDWIQTSNTTGTDEPLVDVVFTYIFNKVSKEVIILKDIKITTTKFVIGPITVPGAGGTSASGLIIQFSNRGEWDLGPSSGASAFQSYVHLYRGNEALSTVYNNEYHLNPTLANSAYSSYGNQPGSSGTYDLAQIISADLTYVGWAAFWPSLSDWSVDAGRLDQWWKSLMAADTHGTDGAGGEPFRSPYLIGEWDFFLMETRTSVSGRYYDKQFRGVTVYGVTDLWDGNDHDYTGSNVIDTEVQYQLEEIFNPWDLYAAVHKDTRRWVEFHTVTAAENASAASGTNLNITLTYRPVRYSATWEDYCNFSERVIWGGELKYPARSVYYSDSSLSAYEPYELYVNETGHGTITIRAASVPAAGTVIKILYSTNCTVTYTENEIANYFGGRLSLGNASLTNRQSGTTGTLVPNTSINSTSWTDVFGIVQNITILYDEFAFNLLGDNMPAGANLSGIDYLNMTVDIKIPPEGGYVRVDNSTYFAQNVSAHNEYNVTFSGNMTVMYKVNPPDSLSGYEHEYVHINGTILIAANHTLFYSGGGYVVTANYTIADALLTKEIMGRYEWVVVGNHSRAIDSVGAAMVSEAFKEKQVIADNGGLDMPDTAWGPRIPSMLTSMGHTTWRPSGPAWCNYYDSIGRLALKDDWCTRYPVSSSNIITVAGPSANLVSEYFNEFSQAIQIYGGIPNISLSDVIFATTCWNTTALSNYLGQYYYSDGQFYTGNTTTGIGVITTYKDLNGTVGFLIHGWSGDDTYYTCKWFQEYGIYYLQNLNRGVTTLVIRLNYQNVTARTSNPMPPYYTYDSHFPYVEIIERLGTISEKPQHDP